MVIFTAFSSSKISNIQVIKLYKLRWQIELYIKRDKSIAEIDFMKFKTEKGVKSWLLGHLLAQEIAKRIGRVTKQINIEDNNDCRDVEIKTEQKEPWIIFNIGWILLKRAILSIEIKLDKDIIEAMKEKIEKTERKNRPRALETFRRRPSKKATNPNHALKKAANQTDSK